MLSQAEARTRVARGAAHLDTVKPGWWERIDTGRLTLHCGGFCVLGQLFMDFWIGVDSLYGIKVIALTEEFGGWTADQLPALHGFVMPTCELASYDQRLDDGLDDSNYESDYQPLQDAWIEAIADRRLAIKPIVAPVPVSASVGV